MTHAVESKQYSSALGYHRRSKYIVLVRVGAFQEGPRPNIAPPLAQVRKFVLDSAASPL